MIEITEETVALWSRVLERGDYLAVLSKAPDGAYELVGRLRLYRDDKLGEDSADEKDWFRVTIKPGGSEADAIEKARGLFDAFPCGPGWELLRGARSLDELVAEIVRMPGIHHKPETGGQWS